MNSGGGRRGVQLSSPRVLSCSLTRMTLATDSTSGDGGSCAAICSSSSVTGRRAWRTISTACVKSISRTLSPLTEARRRPTSRPLARWASAWEPGLMRSTRAAVPCHWVELGHFDHEMPSGPDCFKVTVTVVVAGSSGSSVSGLGTGPESESRGRSLGRTSLAVSCAHGSSSSSSSERCGSSS